MTDKFGEESPPPLPGSSRLSAASAQVNSPPLPHKKIGWLRRWFWTPVKAQENWAQTVFRVLGNLFRSVLTIVVLVIAIGAAVAGYYVAKENRPEWFGISHLTEWCDDQYDNVHSRHERSDKVCSARWAEYDRFDTACRAAEMQTQALLQVDCDLPKEPSFEELKAAIGSSTSMFGNNVIAAANFKREQLKDSLGSQLSTANAYCSYAQSQLEKRRCKLENEKVEEIEMELMRLEELISKVEAESDVYYPALFTCLDARRAKSAEVRDQVIELVESADGLGVGLNASSCAFRARDWAPGIYSEDSPT